MSGVGGIFDNLSDSLGVEFEEEQGSDTGKAGVQLLPVDTDDFNKNKDDFIKTHLMEIIQGGGQVMELLAQEIKTGSKPHFHEIFTTVMKAQLDAVGQLSDLEFKKDDLELKRKRLELQEQKQNTDKELKEKALQISSGNKGGGDLTQNNFYASSPDEIYKLIQAANADSTMNEISAVFEEEAEPDEREE